jgi:hypothetical protein
LFHLNGGWVFGTNGNEMNCSSGVTGQQTIYAKIANFLFSMTSISISCYQQYSVPFVVLLPVICWTLHGAELMPSGHQLLDCPHELPSCAPSLTILNNFMCY